MTKYPSSNKATRRTEKAIGNTGTDSITNNPPQSTKRADRDSRINFSECLGMHAQPFQGVALEVVWLRYGSPVEKKTLDRDSCQV